MKEPRAQIGGRKCFRQPPQHPPASATEGNLPLSLLTAMVIASMIGAVFFLPRTFGAATGPFGGIIAWVIAGGGMHMLALVFQSLAERKPGLDAGVYAYARALSRLPVRLRLLGEQELAQLFFSISRIDREPIAPPSFEYQTEPTVALAT